MMMRSEKEEKTGEDVFLRMGRVGHSHNKLRNEKAMENKGRHPKKIDFF